MCFGAAANGIAASGSAILSVGSSIAAFMRSIKHPLAILMRFRAIILMHHAAEARFGARANNSRVSRAAATRGEEKLRYH